MRRTVECKFEAPGANVELAPQDGRTPIVIVSVALHLDGEERARPGRLLEEVLSWAPYPATVSS